MELLDILFLYNVKNACIFHLILFGIPSGLMPDIIC